MSLCRVCAHKAIAFLLRINFLWVTTGKKKHSVVKNMNGETPNRLLVVQTGVSASQAQDCKAHAARQGLCENLINALKLLAKQQKDGECPTQSTVTGFCERSIKGIMEGLRKFITVDNHSAMDAGHLDEGIRSLEVRRPKLEEVCPEVSIRGRS